MSGRARVDIVIPVYNGLHVLRPCVQSVLRWTSADRAQVTIVNDGSDTHTTEVLRRWQADDPRIRIVHNPRNLGFVRACNVGFGLATGDVVILLNSDVAVTPRWVDKIVRCFDSDPRIGVASPLSNFAPHMDIPMLPGTDFIAMNALVEELTDRRYPDVTTPEGFCFAVSRRCLETVGPFDVVFDRGYGEESDLSMRARYRGFRTVCVDDTYVFHRGRATFTQTVRDELYDQNKRIFHDRWGQIYPDAYGEFLDRDPLGDLRQRLARLSGDVKSAWKSHK